ncbi:MAG TPA: large conductance mechanosensitive channel protein MscL [Verrucomicrobiales bacterium]|nr:large conductance mechanosensitive channel protein MscL [Verrucomicrobiales bacterium]
MINEFRKFILRGNVIDLSTGVIIGVAFTSIVNAFTKGIIEPILKAAGGTPEVSLGIKIGTLTDEAGRTLPNMIDIGMVINAAIGFLITAAVVFFVIVKPANKLSSLADKRRKAASPAELPAEIQLLTEIRDLLRK